MRRRGAVPWLTAFLLACSRGGDPSQANDVVSVDPASSPAAAESPASQPARPNDGAGAAAIPEAYRGEWAPAEIGCARIVLPDAAGRSGEPVRAPGSLQIDAREIRFDEGVARIAEVTPTAGGIALRGQFTYVGDSPYAATLSLSDGRLLVEGSWGEDAFVRCTD